ncbi:hypothetical protein OC835_005124 [Tilletia horrida]|nr:hypothetical protein OC835_005124 [Tilletia horrida]
MSPSSKTVKWPTHLAITADIVVGLSKTNNNNHIVDTMIYDNKNNGHVSALHLWSRSAPEEGAYVLNNAPMATNPIRMHVPDMDIMRHVHEDFDGSDPSKPTLPEYAPIITGTSIVTSVDAEKKNAVFSGFTYMGKDLNYVRYDAHMELEAGPRYQYWFLPDQGTIVSFDAVLDRVEEDGKIYCYIRRIGVIGQAPSALINALGITQVNVTSKSARLRELKANGTKRIKLEEADDSVFLQGTAEAGPSKGKGPADSEFSLPIIPTELDDSQSVTAPSSPTPGLTTRSKRARND